MLFCLLIKSSLGSIYHGHVSGPFLAGKKLLPNTGRNDDLNEVLKSQILLPMKDIQNCPKWDHSRTKKDDIYDVKPSDIKMIVGLGDSISAGFAANSSSGIYNPRRWLEYRGQSFSMGGDTDAISLANFLSYFGSNSGDGDDEKIFLPFSSSVFKSYLSSGAISPVGSSRGKRYLRMCLGGWCPPSRWLYNNKIDGLNAAISGSESDALDIQIGYILNEISSNYQQQISIKEDWKLVTIFIGINDICNSECEVDFPSSPEKVGHPMFYKNQILKAIQRLRESLPRTIVNLVQLFDVSSLDDWTSAQQRCAPSKWMHRHFCPCTRSERGKIILKRRTDAFNAVLEEIWHSYTKLRGDGLRNPIHSDFAVILSPTFKNLKLDDHLPIEFLSKFDCFHPSLLGQQSMAIALW